MPILLVAAIDFGTTFSGYAFSFLDVYKKDPLKIFLVKWKSGMGKLVTDKTSTCVLFNAAGEFHSFGFEAEEKYSELALDDNHHDWYCFRRFKMMLYDKKVRVHFFSLSSSKGQQVTSSNCMHSNFPRYTYKFVKSYRGKTFKSNNLNSFFDNLLQGILQFP